MDHEGLKREENELLRKLDKLDNAVIVSDDDDETSSSSNSSKRRRFDDSSIPSSTKSLTGTFSFKKGLIATSTPKTKSHSLVFKDYNGPKAKTVPAKIPGNIQP